MGMGLLVCTPSFFFGECTDVRRPEARAKRLCRDIGKAVGVALSPGERREFFAEDIPASPLWDVYELFLDNPSLRENSEGDRLLGLVGSDLYLPFPFDSPCRTRLPSYNKEQDTAMSSTSAVTQAIRDTEGILPRFFSGDKLSNSLAVLSVCKDALSVSERVKEPVFWLV